MPIFILHRVQFCKLILFKTQQHQCTINTTNSNHISFTKCNRVYLFFQIKRTYFSFVLNTMNLNSLVSAARDHIDTVRTEWYTSYGSCMTLITEQRLEIFIKDCQSSILGNWCKVFTTFWEIHGVDSIMMVLDSFKNIPVLGIPDNDSAEYFSFTLTTGSQ